MPQVAYYRESHVDGAAAIAMVTAMHKAAASVLGPAHQRTVYMADFVNDVRNGASFTHFERVKVEVADEDAALAIIHEPGFVRFAVGNRTIEELIQERKRLGRADWYC
jgi:hypothetical protein